MRSLGTLVVAAPVMLLVSYIPSPFITPSFHMFAPPPLQNTVILTFLITVGTLSGDILVGGSVPGCVTTSAPPSSVYADFSGNNGNGAGCLWAVQDTTTCATSPIAVDQDSCTCPSATGCSAVDPGDSDDTLYWYWDGQASGVSSCIVPGEGP
jgi:hypothetical protein